MKPQKLKAIAAMVSLACSFSAHAVLERVGPTSFAPTIGGFPAWYQDTTGLTLEFCDPQNTAEVAGGWCLLLPADVPSVPEAFPTAFAPEHFYFAANAGLNLANGGAASLILGHEGGFASGAPATGDHIAFARIRVKLTKVPVTGKYRFIHPYGEELLDGIAGDRIFFSDDVGFTCVEDFTCALGSRLGPFLLPAATPGGAELPAVAGPVAGKLYIADPARSGPVTGSALPNFIDSTGASRNHNIFRIEGPTGSNIGGLGIDFVETTAFSLVGRLHVGGIPGQVSVESASYAQDATGIKLDVFANALPTTQARLPTQPVPAAVVPQLSFFQAPCAGAVDPVTGAVVPPYSAPIGATESVMFADGVSSWGQAKPAAIPAAVCVKDAAARNPLGAVVPAFYPRPVTDEVTISQAVYDPAAGTLSVAASSSNATVPPTLSASFGTFRGDLVSGSLVVPVGFAPPDSVRVFSSAAGVSEARVRIASAAGAPAPAGLPVALNDTYTFLEDAGPQVLALLANDTGVAGGTVTVTSPPRFGSAVVNANGTVTYTANPNVNGVDGFTYTVTVGTTVSNTGNVTLNIVPVNDPPVAVNDTANALVNLAQAIDVLANDTDPDGFADIVAPVIVTPPVGATAIVAGRLVNFTAPAPGTYTFSYQAQDAAGALSAPATVTVQVAAAETMAVSSARFVLRLNRVRVVGTITPVAGQTITAEYANATGTTLGVIGTTTPLADGTWTVEKLGVTALPVGTTQAKTTTSNGTVSFTPFK